MGPKLAELGGGRTENSSRSPIEGLILFLAVLGVTELGGLCREQEKGRIWGWREEEEIHLH